MPTPPSNEVLRENLRKLTKDYLQTLTIYKDKVQALELSLEKWSRLKPTDGSKFQHAHAQFHLAEAECNDANEAIAKALEPWLDAMHDLLQAAHAGAKH